jgi:hypothetical protein
MSPTGFGNMQAGTMRLALRDDSDYLQPGADTVFHISEALTSTMLSPSTGSAFGGTPVFVSGFGFLGDTTVGDGSVQYSYSATFRGVTSPGCQQRNTSLIVCVSPEWFFAAADPVEFVLFRGGAPVQQNNGGGGGGGGGGLAFEFLHDIAANGLSPTVASALAGALLSISGRGFRADSPYDCKWATLHYSHTLLLPARVLNSTLITCVVGYWPYHAGISNFTLLQADGAPVAGRSPLYFEHFAAINASEPTLVFAGVSAGHQVTIFGAGFDPWRGAYLCSVHTGDVSAFTSALARAQEYFKLVCSLPIWTRGAARTSIQVIDALSNETIPAPVNFSLGQQIVEISPPEILAVDNSTRLSIKGGGFEFSPYSVYSLLIKRTPTVHHDQGAGYEGVDTTTLDSVSCPLMEFRSQLLMDFSMPPWHYGAGQMEVILMMDGVEDAHAGKLNLTIKETLSSYVPHSGLVYGGHIRMQGLGFVAQSIYTCRIESVEHPSHAILSEPAVPLSASMLECIMPDWPFEAQEGSITLFREEIPVARTGDTGLYSFIEAWHGSSMSNRLSFSGGQIVTVVGGGFVAAKKGEAEYECRWVAAGDVNRDQEVLLRSRATAHSINTITCTTPSYLLFPFSNGKSSAIFSLWHKINTLAPTLSSGVIPLSSDKDSSGNAWGLVQQAFMAQGTSTVHFAGKPALMGGTLNGAIRGNAPITLHGAEFGFMDTSPQVRIGDSSCEYTQWRADSALICSVPAKGAAPLSNDIIMTVALYHVGTSSAAFSYDGGKIGEVYRILGSAQSDKKVQNFLTRGNVEITVLGVNFDLFDSTVASRIGGTACETTRWSSGTALTSKNSRGQTSANAVALSIAHVLAISTFAPSFSFDVPELAGLTGQTAGQVVIHANAPQVGRSESTVTGTNLGTFSCSPAMSVGASACEKSGWQSDSNVVGRVARGFMRTRAMMITAGNNQRVGTATALLSYEQITLSSASQSNMPVRSPGTLLFGNGLTQVSPTDQLRMLVLLRAHAVA